MPDEDLQAQDETVEVDEPSFADEPVEEESPSDVEESAPDPLEEFRSEIEGRLGEVTKKFEDFDPRRIQGVIDRQENVIKDMTTRLEEMVEKTEATPEIPPDATAAALAEVLATSELLTDADKARLAPVLRSLQDQQQEAKLRKIVRDEVPKPEQSPRQDAAAPDQSINLEALEGRGRLQGYASAKGVEFDSIPTAELQFRAGETVAMAESRVRELIDGMAEEEAAASTTARARKASGNGTPNANAGVSSIERVLERAEQEGIPMTEKEARQQIAKHLGVALSE